MSLVSRIQLIFWLDLTLLVSVCALESITFTGLSLHEWLGMATIALILIHLLMSWAWIAVSSRRLAATNANRTRINYALNFCLFASVIASMFSGLVLSEVALPAFGLTSAAGDIQWRYIHNRVSDLVVILAGLHLAINWEWSVAAAKRCLKLRSVPWQ
jgi:predicted ferric reductase